MIGAILLFTVSSYSIIRGGSLIPDTSSYAAGQSYWSSPATALAGYLGGRKGVEISAILSSGVLGLIIARLSGGNFRAALLCLFPGFPTGCAGADAAGAAAAALASKKRTYYSVLCVATFHLAAALVIGTAIFVSRFRASWFYVVVGIAGVAPIIALPVIGIIRGIGYDQIQWRYLLPSAAIFLSAKVNPRVIYGAISSR